MPDEKGTVTRVDWWDRLPRAKRRHFLVQHQDRLDPDILDKVIKYLVSGSTILVAAGVARDELSPGRTIIGAEAILTDGTFAWSSSLPYYVKTYRIEIPKPFLDHMEKSGWVFPVVLNVSALQIE